MGVPRKRLVQIAANLQAEGSSLEAPLTDNDLALLWGNVAPEAAIEGQKLVFSTLEERNKAAVAHHLDVLGESASPEDVFALAHDLYLREHRADDKVSGRLIAAYAQGADPLLIAAQVISGKSTAGVFDVLSSLEAALPYVDRLSTNGLIELCKSQFEATKLDYMSGHIFSVIRQRLQFDLETCQAVLDEICPQMSDKFGPLYGCATRAWAAAAPNLVVSRVLQDCVSSNVTLAANGVWVLGLLGGDRLVPAELELATWQMLSASSKAGEPAIRRASVMAIEQALDVWPEGVQRLLDLASEGDETALFTISRVLLFNQKLVSDPGIFEKCMCCLARVGADATGTIDNVDQILSRLIREGRPEIAVSYMEKWIASTLGASGADKFCDILDSACHSIFERMDVLPGVLTRWLISPEIPLARAAADVVSALAVRKITHIGLDLDLIRGVDKDGFLHVMRRIIGYVTHEEILLSMIMSVMDDVIVCRYGDDILHDVFVNEIGMDYPGDVIGRLEEVCGSPPSEQVARYCRKYIVDINQYFSSLDELPRLDELRPPASWERSFWKAESKLMEEAQEKANQKSVIRQLMSVVPLKAGCASFNRFNGKYSNPSNLGSVSASFSLPRRHTLDAVGYEIHRLYLRSAKLGD